MGLGRAGKTLVKIALTLGGRKPRAAMHLLDLPRIRQTLEIAPYRLLGHAKLIRQTPHPKATTRAAQHVENLLLAVVRKGDVHQFSWLFLIRVFCVLFGNLPYTQTKTNIIPQNMLQNVGTCGSNIGERP